MDFDNLKSRSQALSEGQWVSDIPTLGDGKLKVLGIRSPAVLRALARAYRSIPFQDRDASGNPTPEAARSAELDSLAHGALLDWENLERGGEPVPFDPDLARQWLEVDLFEMAVRFASTKVQTEVDAKTELVSGNSEPPSAGGAGPAARRKKKDAA